MMKMTTKKTAKLICSKQCFSFLQKSLEGRKNFLKNVPVLSRFLLKNLPKIPIFHEKKMEGLPLGCIHLLRQSSGPPPYCKKNFVWAVRNRWSPWSINPRCGLRGPNHLGPLVGLLGLPWNSKIGLNEKRHELEL